MTLLSNLIKSFLYVPVDEIKKIDNELLLADESNLLDAQHESNAEPRLDHHVQEEAKALSQQMIVEAEQSAQNLIARAEGEAHKLLEAAKQEAGLWWEEQRQQDETLRDQIRQEGFEAGFEEGKQAATMKAEQQYEAWLAEGRNVLEQAYQISRQTIADAEPFLLELSCHIAEKLIGRQLELTPDWVVGTIQQVLKRCSDKGTVALCVSPAQFTYIQSVREELSYVLDAQAELHILPDASVKDHGCVIKTSFGSIDARIETGLFEIKQALLDICRRGEEANVE